MRLSISGGLPIWELQVPYRHWVQLWSSLRGTMWSIDVFWTDIRVKRNTLVEDWEFKLPGPACSPLIRAASLNRKFQLFSPGFPQWFMPLSSQSANSHFLALGKQTQNRMKTASSMDYILLCASLFWQSWTWSTWTMHALYPWGFLCSSPKTEWENTPKLGKVEGPPFQTRTSWKKTASSLWESPQPLGGGQ